MIKTYEQRAIESNNPTFQKLLRIVAEKKSNLVLSIDVQDCNEVLQMADLLGDYICCLKTHVDILANFNMDFVSKLLRIARDKKFLIFEDRKFADIGNTVKLQYSSGIYKIADWADITNAHPIPGDGIVCGLKQVGMPIGRALLILAEMSSKGSLATGAYTQEAIKMAMRHSDFCIGFIGQNRINELDDGTLVDRDFLYMSPGVALEESTDSLGQQYRTPRQVIYESGSDIIIVGREGIYGSENAVESAKKFQTAGWDAYLDKISMSNHNSAVNKMK